MSNSCTNDYAILDMFNASGIADGQWQMHLVNAQFQPSCEKMLTEAMIAPECLIGSMTFAVAIDRPNVCIVSAQDEVRFPGVGQYDKDVAYIVLINCRGLAMAIYGRDIVNNLTRIESRGADLVVKFGEDRAVYGL